MGEDARGVRPYRHARQSLSRVRPGRDDRRRAGAHRCPLAAVADRAQGNSGLWIERRCARVSRSRCGGYRPRCRIKERRRKTLTGGTNVPPLRIMYPKYVPHWIADVEVTPKDSAFFEKRDPATDHVIAQVARGGAAEIAHALSSAAGAAEAWGRTPVPKRGAILGRAAQ